MATELVEAPETALAIRPEWSVTVQNWAGQVLALEAEADALKAIRTEADEMKASEVDRALGEKEREGDRRRLDVIEPYNQLVKAWNGMWNVGKDKVRVAREKVKALMAQRARETRKAAEAEAEAERKRLAKNYAAQTKRAEVSGREAPPPPPPVEAVKVSKVGGSTISMVWKIEVEDIKAVPAKYLLVDKGLIKADLVAAERQGQQMVIPGIKAGKVESVAS